MRGLVEKDLRLILHRKQTLVMFLAVAVVMGFSVSGSFIVGYLTMLSAIVSVGTLSYDEFDNGYAFLMTLPVDRKTYVLEKYLFSLGVSFAGWCLSLVLYAAGTLIRGDQLLLAEELPGLAAMLPTMYLTVSAMIPLQLKYGSEKSRTVLFAVFGAIALIFLALTRLIGQNGPDVFDLIRETFGTYSPAFFVAVLFAASALLSFLSCLWSIRIMKRKEF